MMKYTPLVRSDSAPTARAYTPAARTEAPISSSTEPGSLSGESSTVA